MLVEQLTSEDRDDCIALASGAFEDYDFFTAYFPQSQTRRRFLQNLFAAEFGLRPDGAHYLTVKEDGQLLGLAILHEPGLVPPSDWQYLRAGFWKNFFLASYTDILSWIRMEKEAQGPCQQLPGQPWYLHILAVSPLAKGKGIGSRMLADVIVPYVQERGGQSLCFYTNSEGNRKFYQKNGFEEFHFQQFCHKGQSLGSWSFCKDLGPADK